MNVSSRRHLRWKRRSGRLWSVSPSCFGLRSTRHPRLTCRIPPAADRTPVPSFHILSYREEAHARRSSTFQTAAHARFMSELKRCVQRDATITFSHPLSLTSDSSYPERLPPPPSRLRPSSARTISPLDVLGVLLPLRPLTSICLSMRRRRSRRLGTQLVYVDRARRAAPPSPADSRGRIRLATFSTAPPGRSGLDGAGQLGRRVSLPGAGTGGPEQQRPSFSTARH